MNIVLMVDSWMYADVADSAVPMTENNKYKLLNDIQRLKLRT
jgi:hypothetical protein